MPNLLHEVDKKFEAPKLSQINDRYDRYNAIIFHYSVNFSNHLKKKVSRKTFYRTYYKLI